MNASARHAREAVGWNAEVDTRLVSQPTITEQRIAPAEGDVATAPSQIGKPGSGIAHRTGAPVSRAVEEQQLSPSISRIALSTSSARFTAVELVVIALSRSPIERRKRRGSGSFDRVARIIEFMFRYERPAPLADPRLEALRCMSAVLYDTDMAPTAHILAAFLNAGFEVQQIDVLRSFHAQARSTGSTAKRPYLPLTIKSPE